MNKVLHLVVYLILIVAVAALVFEKSLFDKRALLGDRNRMLEDYIVKIASTIEKADAPASMMVPEAKKDISPVEARLSVGETCGLPRANAVRPYRVWVFLR